MRTKEQQGLVLEVSPDAMAVTLHAAAGLSRVELDVLVVGVLLRERGVSLTQSVQKRVAEFIDDYFRDGAPERFCTLAEGTPARHGIDGRIELAAPSGPGTGVDTGRVDHHSRQSLRLVHKGVQVARIYAPTPGEDGCDANGKVLAARNGRRAALPPHDSIEVRPDGTVFALVGGILEFEDGRLRVNPTLVVRGSVDFHTGNIEFPGDVVVEKGVRDCFVIRAGRSITVRDLADAATFEAAQDIVLEMGIAARELGAIRAGRDLVSRYLTNVRAEAGRDARVSGEIQHVHLTVGRDLLCPTGKLHSGDVAVARACEVAELGCEGGTRVNLSLGSRPEVTGWLTKTLSLYTQLQESVRRHRQELTDLKKLGGKLTPQRAERLTELEFVVPGDEACLAKTVRAFLALAKTLRHSVEVNLKVHSHLHKGVSLDLGPVRADFARDLRGPLTIRLDASGSPVVVVADGPARALSEFAKVRPVEGHIGVREVARAMGVEPLLEQLAA